MAANSSRDNAEFNWRAAELTPPASAAGSQPGGLIAVAMRSKVGVLLDEIPNSMRDQVARRLVAKSPEFWQARARRQLHLTTYRLVFREAFYDPPRKQLPLPPESVWQIKVLGPAHRKKIEGHDLVLVDYLFKSVLLTDADSPGGSEPRLKHVGGKWEEPFTLPVDPELIFQRTRYACLDEGEFPPLSVDSEEIDSFYDDSCGVEATLTKTGCHQTELSQSSCVDALKSKIGSIETTLQFLRLPWDKAMADKFRVGPVTNPAGADLQIVHSELQDNRLVYRYVSQDSCALAEDCVSETGWRRLLEFSASTRNTGTKALNIGAVDYFIAGVVNPLQAHHVFEFSACHHHYHFRHFGSFSFGGPTAPNEKRAFCLQTTFRYSNVESSPINNPYGDCSYQGVEAGWGDEYKAGLECQWLDITDVNTVAGPVTLPLTFVSNPDQFLCEGTPVLDANGDQVFLPTPFTTEIGEPVDRPACDFFPNWFDNNTDSVDITVPLPGEGYVTAPCAHGEIGPLRNCGFAKQADATACLPGTPVSLHLTAPAGGVPQVIRICESSAVLGVGVACTYQDSLATAAVPAEGTDLLFTCPGPRSATEPGGSYSVYTAPVFVD